MNKALPSRERAIQILKDAKCRPQIINHCIAVTDYALNLACRLQQKGHTIDLSLVEAGGLLHDLGRAKNQSIDHAVVGGQMAETLGLPEGVLRIIKRHVGAGIPDEEAQLLGWSRDTYMPETLEEKIVCYADKRVDQSGVVPIDNEIARLLGDGRVAAAERVRRLHVEITNLLGNPQ
ncbi:MAG TPA: HDIG domain-containing protein [Candidatus Deferrimicrobiaceae bacterium]|nr:HDIG domain-containing protein [Candidatus Deferrimicrobiaceae bacterium]